LHCNMDIQFSCSAQKPCEGLHATHSQHLLD
jgi:hypothetical protein